VDDACIFCQIVRGEAPASIVYEDDTVIAFLDAVPITRGHILVIPRRHAASLATLDPADGRHVFSTAQSMGAVLRKSGLRCDAVNLLLNDGVEAGQRVFHIHMHVIPRWKDDNARMRRDPSEPQSPREDLDAVAAQIRAALD
jgi:diadenosine tetraphosphate (Ap4A) HIT family hydrolase